MRNRVRVSATGVLISGAVALLGGILAATTAFATPAAPTNIVIHSDVDVDDNYVNATEVAAGITVTGDFAIEVPPVAAIKVEIVNSASCAAGAAQHAPADGKFALATITSPTTFSVTLNVSHFDEGAVLCARARSSSDGTNYSLQVGTSAIKPVKDTVVNAGTVVMVDPTDDGYLNLAEQTAGSVAGTWTASDADATNADAWFGPAATTSNYPHVDCGVAPAALVDYTSPASGNMALTTACATAIPEGDTFSLNAKWRDAAGNTSILASAVAPMSRPLVKDTTAPALPTVSIVTDPIKVSNVASTLVDVTAETNATINLALSSSGLPASTPLSQVKLATLPAPVRFTFNASSLSDCSASKVGLVGEVRPNCVLASATASDAAGNTSGAGTDVAYKDATAPAAPVIDIVPGVIQSDVNTEVELETTGETWTAVAHTLSDQDPATGDLTAATNTENLGGVALIIDTAPLTDGIVTARTTLTDGVGNVSPAGIKTATKGLTTGSVAITAPAANSLNTSMPGTKIAGTATPLSTVGVWEVSTAGDEAIATNISVDEFGSWSTTYRFLTSGTKTIYARKLGDTVGSAVRIFEVDPINPTVDSSTLDYAVYTPGQPIILEGTARDDFSGVAAVEIEAYDVSKVSTPSTTNPTDIRFARAVQSDLAATCPQCSLTSAVRNVIWSYDFSNLLSRGVYQIHATSIDRAGNRAVDAREVNIIVL